MPIRTTRSGKRVVISLAAVALVCVIAPVGMIAYQVHAARQNWLAAIERLRAGDTTFEATCVASEELRDIEYIAFRSREAAGVDHILRLGVIDDYRMIRLLSGTSSEKFHRQLDDAMNFDVSKNETAAQHWMLRKPP